MENGGSHCFGLNASMDQAKIKMESFMLKFPTCKLNLSCLSRLSRNRIRKRIIKLVHKPV